MENFPLTDDQVEALSLILFFLTPDGVYKDLVSRGVPPANAKKAANALRDLNKVFNK